ncbi:MED22 [Bugula neritina]|uniref:Mediator of RNA polymerase II transcription subunit 22 n=1 Tax=Bugula neritina TaxID=10212 RepID=A0A7J7K357_BUGNE|nr:MED22 [Bugula neritina]
MLDNFTEIIRQAKVTDSSQTRQTTEGEQVNYEISVRAANVVRAGDSLMKLVSDLKQFLILNDFSAIGDSVESSRMKDEVASDLYLLEDEYFNSAVK